MAAAPCPARVPAVMEWRLWRCALCVLVERWCISMESPSAHGLKGFATVLVMNRLCKMPPSYFAYRAYHVTLLWPHGYCMVPEYIAWNCG